MNRQGCWMMLAAVALAGCQPRTEPKALERLPDPYYVEHQASPTPPSVPPAVSTPAAAPGWLPSRGISSRWRCIVIHHSASGRGSMREINFWHRENGWESCGYHFVIGNGSGSGDGQIEIGPRWRDQTIGAHTRLFGSPGSPEGNYYNEHGIGIVLVGNFEAAPASNRQLDALARLIKFLMGRCNIPLSRVYTHGELKATDCPGRHFSKAELMRRIKALP